MDEADLGEDFADEELQAVVHGRWTWGPSDSGGEPRTQDTQDKGTQDEGCRRLVRDAFRSAMNPDP